MNHSPNIIRAGAYLVELACVAAAFWAIGFACVTAGALISREPVTSCQTDAECAALPECASDPACDGGPVPMSPRMVIAEK